MEGGLDGSAHLVERAVLGERRGRGPMDYGARVQAGSLAREVGLLILLDSLSLKANIYRSVLSEHYERTNNLNRVKG